MRWAWSMLFGYLVVAAIARGLQRCAGDRGPRALPLALGLLAWVPVGGLPLARWLYGYSANFSVPTAALLLQVVLQPLTGRPLLDAVDRRTMYGMALAAGLILYPAAMGWGPVDSYAWGWGTLPLLSSAVTPLVVVLLFRRSAVGLVLLATAAAWQLGLLESNNLWDYLIDPLLFLFALVAWPIGARRSR